MNSASARLSFVERLGLLLVVYVLIYFGLLVLLRGAFLQRRMTDLGCFQRAAWAVRTGGDIYGVTDDNNWHYNYPPLFAILAAPIADPPLGESRMGYLPHAWSVVIMYVVSLASLCFAVHMLASVIESTWDPQEHPRFCRRWWALRILPVLICLAPVGHTMMRGQVNLMIIAMLCAALAAWMQGKSMRAGLWLSLAICIKVIPAYLLVYPAWKRDWRALGGCSAGLFAGLVVIPALVFGPDQAMTHYQTYGRVFFGPFLNVSDDTSRRTEITGVNSTDSVGVKNAIHNWMYRVPETRPSDMHVAGKAAYLLLGIAMTLVTLWPRLRTNSDSSTLSIHQYCALMVLMMMFSPVSHSHYLAFCLPIVMCLLARAWQGQVTLHVPGWLVACFALYIGTIAIAYLPGMEILKDRCAALFAVLPLWVIPVVQLWRGEPSVRQEIPLAESLRRAA